ncbi:MAG: hypothetical protein HYY48_10865 [Gammaproteobacteria bacterium]|nr:hypothetical protein [Gammaproteobacteria bacterium]
MNAAARGQRGAVLLVFMLVLVVGSSYMLVSRLNEYAQAYAREAQTQSALAEAKQALLFYAMNYPDLNTGLSTIRGPGYLPCPDQNDDGATETNCSDTTGSTLGRLPYSTLGLSELTDSSGEMLWYAVSQNLKYNQSSDYILNSDTPGTISVDGSDDVVAVIIAPGEPVADQSGRRGTAETTALLERDVYDVADQYLEDDNATNGDASYVSESSDDFNDQVVTITRQELMAVVEQRVANEARQALGNYYDEMLALSTENPQRGAYPWLAPFADPKSSPFVLRGTHDGSDDSTNDLDDSSRDFTQWGVAIGDTVWNLTDGSVGVVDTTPTATRLSMSGGLALGTDNDFDDGDEYVVEAKALAGAHAGTATAGSDNLALEDTARDFEEQGVSAGDVVENITDGSSGIVASVDSDTLTVSSLAGGAENDFDLNDSYRVRTNAGQATAGSSGTTLEDTDADFTVMGVQEGDLVHNLTDNSYGRVASGGVAATTLTVDSLEFGTGNQFSTNDYYEIPRFYGSANTPRGLLSIHEPGEAFATGFDVDWSTPSVSPITVTTTASGTNTTYNNGLYYWLLGSSGYSGTVQVPDSGGACTWITEEIADCRGEYVDSNFLTGAVTSTFTSSPYIYVYDTSKNFPSSGVKVGDRILNITTNVAGIISVASTTYPTRVRVTSITGETAFSASVGDSFRIYVAANRSPASGASPSTHTANASTDTAANLVCVDAVDFTSNPAVEPGDVIRDTSDATYGLVMATSWDGTMGCITYTDMIGGGSSTIGIGDYFRISYDFVSERHYLFDVRISGTTSNGGSAIGNNAGMRDRDVCLGYGADCTNSTASNAEFDAGNSATITIEDYDSAATLLGSRTVTAPSSGSPVASIRLDGIDYYLEETEDAIPEWFLKNKWHRFVYAAYSSEYQPGNVGTGCVEGTNCLSLSVPLPADTTLDDRQALVISAGPELSTQASSRLNGALDAYFEDDNAVADDVFSRDEVSTTFNDLISVIAP